LRRGIQRPEPVQPGLIPGMGSPSGGPGRFTPDAQEASYWAEAERIVSFSQNPGFFSIEILYKSIVDYARGF
jgi:hypothetical protein